MWEYRLNVYESFYKFICWKKPSFFLLFQHCRMTLMLLSKFSKEETERKIQMCWFICV
jgi:hypothetical protein